MKYDIYYSTVEPLPGLLIHIAPEGTIVGAKMVPPRIKRLTVDLQPEDLVELGALPAVGGDAENPTWSLLSRYRFITLPTGDIQDRDSFFANLDDRVPVAEYLFSQGIVLRR